MKKLLILVLLMFAVGCAKKYTKTPDQTAPAADEPIAEETIEMTEEVVEEVEIPSDDMVSSQDIAAREMSIEDKAQQIFQDVLFDYDRYEIRDESRTILNAVATFLQEEKELNIAIEGHCDDRGTNEYNLALGEKRAKATKNYLVSLGTSPDRISIVTYGEEKQLCLDQTEECWQQNRRAHFVILK